MTSFGFRNFRNAPTCNPKSAKRSLPSPAMLLSTTWKFWSSARFSMRASRRRCACIPRLPLERDAAWIKTTISPIPIWEVFSGRSSLKKAIGSCRTCTGSRLVWPCFPVHGKYLRTEPFYPRDLFVNVFVNRRCCRISSRSGERTRQSGNRRDSMTRRTATPRQAFLLTPRSEMGADGVWERDWRWPRQDCRWHQSCASGTLSTCPRRRGSSTSSSRARYAPQRLWFS